MWFDLLFERIAAALLISPLSQTIRGEGIGKENGGGERAFPPNLK